MKFIEFLKYAKKHDERFYKKILVSCILLCALLFLNGVMDYFRVKVQVMDSVNEINQVDELMKNQAEYEENKQKVIKLLNNKKIAKINEIDNIQKDIIQMASQFDVNVQRINVRAIPEMGELYELTIIAEWSNSMKYLYYLSNNTALIKIIDLSVEADVSNQVICTAHYKIYKED